MNDGFQELRRMAVAMVVGLTVFSLPAPVTAVEWADAHDPELFARGTESARAEGFASSIAKQPDLGSGVVEKANVSLNGQWKFQLAERRQDVPQGFEAAGFDDSAWRSISVPGSWQAEGLGKPYFLSSGLPFAVQPPQIRLMQKQGGLVEAGSPVGVYRTRFQLPQDWTKQRVLLHFGGFDSSLQLWLNGKALGYAEDGRVGAEFDLTESVVAGENVLAVAVTQFCDGSYLESQPVVRLAGLQRDVTLWCAPPVRVSDHFVQTQFDPKTAQGRVRIALTLKNAAALAGEGHWRFLLSDAQGMLAEHRSATVKIGPQAVVDQAHELKMERSVRPWSAEQPQLYDYVLQWCNERNEVLQELRGKTGFRRSRWNEGHWELNDQPVEVRGVVRFDTHPRRGRSLSVDDMRQELLQMKRANINAIRTGFAPPDAAFLSLCDELGFYVFAEPNLQLPKDGQAAILADPRWQAAIVQRIKAELERDKNHVAVVSWVLPEWVRRLPAATELIKWAGQRDSSRAWSQLDPKDHVVQRLSSTSTDASGKGGLLAEWGEVRGNSGADLMTQWQRVFSAGMQGGFCAYWRDQALVNTRHASKTVEDVSKLKHSCRLLGRLDEKLGLHRGAAIVRVSEALNSRVPFRIELRCLLSGQDWQRVLLLSDGEGGLELSAEKISSDQVRLSLHESSTAAPLVVTGDISANDCLEPVRITVQWLVDRCQLSVNERVIGEAPVTGQRDAVAAELWIVNGDWQKSTKLSSVAVQGLAVWRADSKSAATAETTLLDLRFTDAAAKPAVVKSLDYGGDFDEFPDDGAALAHGLTTAAGLPNPLFEELKKAYQPMSFRLLSQDGELKIAVKNRQSFEAGDAWKGSWKLLRNGEVVDQGDCPPSALAAGAEQVIALRPKLAIDGQNEWIIRMRYDLTQETAWNPVGMPVAWAEILLAGGKRPPSVWLPQGQSAPQVTEKADRVLVQAGDVQYAVSRQIGMLVSMKKADREWLKTPLQLVFSRPSTELERSAVDHEAGQWQAIAGSGKVSQWSIERGERDVVVKCDLGFAAGVKAGLCYRFDGAGRAQMETRFDPGTIKSLPPRLGYRCRIEDGATDWQWLGKGPQENYRGRCDGAWTAVHAGVVGSVFHRYLVPQESGNRTAVRWTQLNNVLTGAKWRVDSDDALLDVKVLPCDERELDLASHAVELLNLNEVHVCLDHWTSANAGSSLQAKAVPQQWSMLLTLDQGSPAPRRSAQALPPGFPLKTPTSAAPTAPAASPSTLPKLNPQARPDSPTKPAAPLPK